MMTDKTHVFAPYAQFVQFTSQYRLKKTFGSMIFVILFVLSLFVLPNPAHAQAYGSINNFDCVNDTTYEAHGFDIELDDIHSTDITYTYDFNHYGVPKITEDKTDPLHPKVLVRYAGTFSGGVWSAYTAIPSGPIAPTQGHQFTDPSVNFGGEHFGVGYTVNPTAVKYNWLIDPTNSGTLSHGPPVNVSTPVFTYNPPIPFVAPANVVAVIVPPPPPVLPPKQFGDASWVKEIKTTTHNAGKVHLNDLVADDPGNPQPWANGEPAEVEVEWRILQTDFNAADGGAKGQLAGAAEDLPGGDEVITRRYEFYKYLGPFDAESNEAMADTVGPDGIHGSGTVTYNDHIDPLTGEWVTVTVDLSTVEVVGDFFGAQMSAFDNAPVLGLIDHIQDGDVGTPYPDRTVVIGGNAAFLAGVKSGSLPTGLSLDPVSGVLSGTPTAAGVFTFEVEASDFGGAYVTSTYTVTIAGGAAATYNIATSASPAAGGTTSGDGSYNSGDSVTVVAAASPGYTFLNWTHGGTVYSSSASYTFTATANTDLVANFLDPTPPVTAASLAGTAGTNGWYTGTVQVTLTPTDADGPADIANTYVVVDGGVRQTYTGPFNVAGDGAHVVSFWSVDKSGNEEAPHNSMNINIDGTVPSLTFGAPSPAPNAGWNNSAVDVPYTTNDNLSGVASAAPGSPLHFGSEGANQTQTVVVTDNAGNSASFQSPAVNIDMTAPTLTASANPNRLYPHNGKMDTVTITGSVSDALSGVDASSGSYSTVDSYGLIQPAGTFSIGSNGSFSFTVQLESRLTKKDIGGRTYTVTINVRDIAGNPVSTEVLVTVPYRK